jgi:hypothetical protein
MTDSTNLCAELQQIEQESALRFALKWSSIGTAVGLCLLMASCSSFLPKETPRYNQVVGERRMPPLNAQMLSGGAPMQPDMQTEMLMQSPIPAPVPLVAPHANMAAAPMAVPAPMPVEQSAVQMVTPSPAPTMMDQMTGQFSTQPLPETDNNFPKLMPTQPAIIQEQSQAQWQSERATMEAEMAALERELMQAQQQQAQLASLPSAIPTEAPTPLASGELPWHAQALEPAPIMQPAPLVAPPAAGSPALLPLPAPPSAPAASVSLQQQPLPEEAFEPIFMPAPVVSAAPLPAPIAWETQPSFEVAPPPPVYALTPPSPEAFSGLTPPAPLHQLDVGLLPASRYEGRRLRTTH